MAKKNQFLIDGLFGFDGRFRRSEYWVASICMTFVRVVILLIICGTLGVGLTEATAMPAVRLGLDLLFLWPAAAITIKRGHDRNRSAWFTGGLLALVYGSGAALAILPRAGNELMVLAISLPMLPVVLYMLIDYGFIDGTKGDNRYGPSPKFVGPTPTLTLDQ